ncbi:hypothetical protein QFC19_009097 [Naganishia cerealis]|uniref:Uncharacterized protein n=1 Tax=Naganishia cerealis TaxID=610337 RepID=A0ACC2UXR2_9TREE|nr:hypothetical protein QFC19_009097 [Naganishia cerealis]
MFHPYADPSRVKMEMQAPTPQGAQVSNGTPREEDSTRPRFMAMFDSGTSTRTDPVLTNGTVSGTGAVRELSTAVTEQVPAVPQAPPPPPPPPPPSVSVPPQLQTTGPPVTGVSTSANAGIANGIIQPGISLSELPASTSSVSVSMPYPPFTAPLPASTSAAPPPATSTNANSTTPVLPLRNRSSCTNCRQRKQRCDHGPPGQPCKGCLKGGKVCVYPGGIVLTPGPGTGTGTPSARAVSTGGKDTPTHNEKLKKGALMGPTTGNRSDTRHSLHPSQLKGGNREFTDSEDSGRASSDDDDNDDPSKRHHPAASTSRANRRTNGHGDEVDELDEEEEDEGEDDAASNDSDNEMPREGSSSDEDVDPNGSTRKSQQHYGSHQGNGNVNVPHPYVAYGSMRHTTGGRESTHSNPGINRIFRPATTTKDDAMEDDDGSAESGDGKGPARGEGGRPLSRQVHGTHSSTSPDGLLTFGRNSRDLEHALGGGGGGGGTGTTIGSHKPASATATMAAGMVPAGAVLGGGGGAGTGRGSAGLVHERFMGGLGPDVSASAATAAAAVPATTTTAATSVGSESPFTERRAGKRKSMVGVTEGEVEGEILALVEEDQRPSKHKKSRFSSPRRSGGGGGDPLPFQSNGDEEHHHSIAGDSFFPPGAGTNSSARYSADFNRPHQHHPHPPPALQSGSGGGGGGGGGGFPLSSGRSVTGYSMGMGGGFPGHTGGLIPPPPSGGGQFPHAGGHPQGSTGFMPQMGYPGQQAGRSGSLVPSAGGSAGMVLGYPPFGPSFAGGQLQQQMGMGMGVGMGMGMGMGGGMGMGMPGMPPQGMRYDLPPFLGRGSAGSLDFSPRTISHDSVPALLQGTASPYASSLAALLTVLPPPGTQHILYQTFFQDPFLAEGVTLLQAPFLDDLRYLLHRRSTQQQQQQQQGQGQPQVPMEALKAGDATILALAFAILANALRILPEESSQLLLSSVDQYAYPRGLDRVITGRPGALPASSMDDKTPLHRRYMDHAILASALADAEDSPSPMQVCLKLVCYRYTRMCAAQTGINVSTGQMGKARLREKLTSAGMYLVQGIKMAQAIKLHREREGVPTVERELKRRMFYALYVADRVHAFETSSPYMIHDQHTSTHLPAAVSDPELYQLSTGSLSTIPHHDYKHNPASVVHLVVMAHIAKSMSSLMDTLAVYTAADISSEAVDRYDAAFQACEDDLPSYYQLSPATNTNYDVQNPYLLFHRIDVQSFLYGLRLSLYRPKLNAYLSIKTPHSLRNKLSKLCFRALRVQRSARIQESKFAFRLFSVEKVFEAAFVLAFIARVELAYTAADKAQPHGAAAYPVASEESIEDMQQALHDAIELLEGVTAWPDAGSLAVKASKILRKIAKMLSASWNLESRRMELSSSDSIKSNPHVVRVSSWLKSWRGINVDTLVAEADYDDWNKVLRSMQA